MDKEEILRRKLWLRSRLLRAGIKENKVFKYSDLIKPENIDIKSAALKTWKKLAFEQDGETLDDLQALQEIDNNDAAFDITGRLA